MTAFLFHEGKIGGAQQVPPDRPAMEFTRAPQSERT